MCCMWWDGGKCKTCALATEERHLEQVGVASGHIMEAQRSSARPSGNIVQGVLVQCMWGALALKLEHQHAAVMSCGKQVDLWVRSQDPEALVLAAEGLQSSATRHVPDADGAVLTVADNHVLPAAENHT